MDMHPIRQATQLRFQPGEKLGRLTVLWAVGSKHFKSGVAVVFLCRCDCGREVERDRQSLTKKRDHCCPACAKAHPGVAPVGSSGHPLYKTWWQMIDRCTNPKNKSYPDYGARGIGVAERWVTGEDPATGFECFVWDMGAKPNPAFTIERADPDGGYGPENCAWATRTAQSRNRRGLRMLTVGNRTQPASVWAEEAGVPYFTLMRRLDRGWTAEQAIVPGDGRSRRD